MRTRTRWTSKEIVVPDGDPFDQRVQQLGMPIQLSEGRAGLEAKLVELVAQEGLLWNAGVRCAIKDKPDTTCSACPLCAANDPESALQALCLVGRAEERVLTEIACAKEIGRAEGKGQ